MVKDLSRRAGTQGFARFQPNPGQPLVPPGADVKPFKMNELAHKELPTYSQIKASFTPESASQAARFVISEMVASQLSVEEEERKRFEKKLQEALEQRLAVIGVEAHAEGFKKGHAEGVEKAYAEEKARFAANNEHLASAIVDLANAKEQLASQYEQALTDIAFKIAEAILHTQIRERPDVVKETVKAILERISREDDVRIRLASEEFERIDAIKADIEKLGRTGLITYEVDPNLKTGNCVVESMGGEIASFLSEKVELLRQQLKARNLNPTNVEKKETGT